VNIETNDDPLVSVVIPMYQAEAWILDTLASVAAQTYPQVETIVVDDGSTDRGAHLVAEFAESADTPLHLIRSENQGVASARNRGIAESTGPLVALLDADDRWLPRKLELQVARIVQSSAPMCLCGYELVADRTGRRVGVVNARDGPRALSDWLALEGNGLLLPSTALIRRTVLDDLKGFDPEFSVSADLDFALRIEDAGHLVFVPEVLVQYRIHSGQMHRQLSEHSADMSRVYDRVFAGGRYQSIERRCRANLAAHTGFSELLRGRFHLGIRHLVRSMRLDPRRLVTLPVHALLRRTGRRSRSWFTGGVSR